MFSMVAIRADALPVMFPIENLRPPTPGYHGRFILSTLNENKLRRLLAYMLDESEFLSPYGIRSISKFHREHLFGVRAEGKDFIVSYQAAESQSGLFGGNSN
jgi:hypothetical protein